MAFCGDNIRMRISGVSDRDITPGFVLTSVQKPVKAVTAFKADISFIDTKNIICPGYSCVLHVHTLAEEVSVTVSTSQRYTNNINIIDNNYSHSSTITRRRLGESPRSHLSSPRLVCLSLPSLRLLPLSVLNDSRTTKCLVDSLCVMKVGRAVLSGLSQLLTDIALGKTVAIGKVTKLIERSEDMPDVAALSLKAAS